MCTDVRDLLGVGAALVELLGSLVVLDVTADGDRVTDLQISTAGESVALDDVVIEAADLDVDGDVAVLLAIGAGDGNDCSGYLSCSLESLAFLKLIGLEEGLD